MKLFTQINQLEHIHFHIEHRSTGSPREFARKLNVSVRSLNRIFEELQDCGIRIVYSRARTAYEYMDDHKLPSLLKRDTERKQT